jgi:hypothetical protein
MKRPTARQTSLILNGLAVAINLFALLINLAARRWEMAGFSAVVAAAVACLYWFQTTAHARHDAWLRKDALLERRMAAETRVSEEVLKHVQAGQIEVGMGASTRH